MGLVFKSVFWLGIVYWAMPFDQVPGLEDVAAVCPSVYASASHPIEAVPEPYRKFVAAGCVALAEGRIASAWGGPKPATVGARSATTGALENREREIRLAREPGPPPRRRPNKG